ncbi:MAG: DUF4292 domain-containing protein [Paludibacter sp.]|nr:DUF4292 domain-containing protein [Paludibacter sp.]
MVGKDNIQFRVHLLLFLIPVLLSGGCKSLQKVNFASVKDKNTTMTVEKILSAEPHFRYLDIKKMNLKVNLNNQNEYNSPANCKIITDSAIHISVQPFFGLEMFVARFTPDTFIFIDKTKNICYQADYAFLNSKFNLNLSYNTIQAILTNRLFAAGENQMQSAIFENLQDRSHSTGLQYENDKYTGTVKLIPDFRISEVEVNVKTGPDKFYVSYTEFGDTGKSISFPFNLDFKVSNSYRELGLSMNILKLIADETITLPELNLNKYQKGNISTLLK